MEQDGFWGHCLVEVVGRVEMSGQVEVIRRVAVERNHLKEQSDHGLRLSSPIRRQFIARRADSGVVLTFAPRLTPN